MSKFPLTGVVFPVLPGVSMVFICVYAPIPFAEETAKTTKTSANSGNVKSFRCFIRECLLIYLVT
jgi:hypothetical protein